MNIAIVGSRGFRALKRVQEFVKQELNPGDTVVTGGALGVDMAAMEAVKKAGLSMLVHYPNWNMYGKGAGYERNVKIIDDADVVVAFWDGISKGTAHSIKTARDAGKVVKVFVEDQAGNIMEVE